jgi:Beta-propeller repeat
MKRFNLVSLFNAVTICCATAQIQEAWVARYDDGRPGSTNRAVAIAVDNSGNVLVAGSSTTTTGDFDYVTIKYAPHGTQLWARRYASGAGSNDQVRALAVDSGGNVLVTGTSDTVKYDAEGTLLWAAPYGGRAMAVDPAGNAYVTGFRTNEYATVKLDPNASNLWLRTY